MYVVYRNMTRTIIREAGVFVFAEVTDMGLVLQWDRGTRAYLRLDTMWQARVSKGELGSSSCIVGGMVNLVIFVLILI